MKSVIIFFFACLISGIASAQSKTSVPDKTKPIENVEASCGECQFKLDGKGCHLAVRVNGKAYFVDGTSIDEHGDAHSSDGFCETVRKAEVQGEVVNDRFRVTYFKLMPVVKEKKDKDKSKDKKES